MTAALSILFQIKSDPLMFTAPFSVDNLAYVYRSNPNDDGMLLFSDRIVHVIFKSFINKQQKVQKVIGKGK
jgi:hypothetical protein